MKRNQIIFLFLTISFFSTNRSSATIFTAIADDDWDLNTTWDQDTIPTASDTVVIDGFTVTIDINSGNVSVKRLVISNSSNTGGSELIIDGLITLSVSDDLAGFADTLDHDVELTILNGATLNVGGDVDFSRASNNIFSRKLLLTIADSSRMNVTGSFDFDYKNSSGGENYNEIFLDNTAILDVAGNTNIYVRGGNDFDFTIQGSSQAILRSDLNIEMSGGDKMTVTSKETAHFQVTGNVSVTNSGSTTHAMLHADGSTGKFTLDGNLAMTSTVADKIVFMEATNSNCIINVAGDISMSAASEGDVYIDLKASSNMYLGGDFLRPTNFGALLMSDGSTLTYNGTEPQVLACEDLPGSGTDAFNYSNVVMNNSSGFSLEGPTIIDDNLDLNNGILTTSTTNTLTISDQATLTGGSENAFINGPLIKKGRSNGSPFVFYVGEGTKYAPIEVSAISSSASEYQAQYFSCPPPFGNHLAEGVAQVSPGEFWTLSRTSGSDAVDVTLHWMDAAESGITDTDSLIVTYYDEVVGWTSAGNGGVTGGVGEGVSGSISNLLSCPPPFGSEKFTFGTVSELTPLPVELVYFNAQQDGSEVLLDWETSSETNSSHFVVEKSTDGVVFEILTTVPAQGFSSSSSFYQTKDSDPDEHKNYYRLHQVDIDGMNDYSEIVVVSFQSFDNNLILFPNPVGEYIQLSSKDYRPLETKIDIFDQMGQLLYSGVQTMMNGNLRIPTNQLSMSVTSNYFIVLQNENGVQSLQFVKTN